MANTLIVSASVQEPLPTNISHQLLHQPLIFLQQIISAIQATSSYTLEKLRTSQCTSNYHELLKLVSEKHSSSKVIVSSLLNRADGIDKQRQEFNTKLGHLCAPYPNVHLVNNENITVENLYDSKHLKRKRIGLLVTNLKETVFNRIRRIQSRNLPSTQHSSTRPTTITDKQNVINAWSTRVSPSSSYPWKQPPWPGWKTPLLVGGET